MRATPIDGGPSRYRAADARPWRVVATHTFYVYAATEDEAIERGMEHADIVPPGEFGELDTRVRVEDD